MSITIILADDHQIFRQGLRSLLEQEPELEVVAEADNGRTAVELTEKLKPDVVIMDISMSDLNGTEATHQIIRRVPGSKVVGLSMHSDKRFVEGMLQAGARGYLQKSCDSDEFIRAIRAVAAGQTYLSPAVAAVVVQDYVHQSSKCPSSALDELTPREREVLQLVAEGSASKQIAAKLTISAKTVDTHRHQLMEKLNIHSLSGLTKFAVREGLTSLE